MVKIVKSSRLSTLESIKGKLPEYHITYSRHASRLFSIKESYHIYRKWYSLFPIVSFHNRVHSYSEPLYSIFYSEPSKEIKDIADKIGATIYLDL